MNLLTSPIAKALLPIICISFTSCIKKETGSSLPKGTYGYDVAFLKKYKSGIIELQDETGKAKVLLAAGYQGRVMTSTSAGDTGLSYGWLNYGLIQSGEKKKQFNPVGGEERLWLGPEGGQYSIYFEQGDSFKIEHWQVPPILDTIAYDLVQVTPSLATFTKKAHLKNYSGQVFDFTIERTIVLLTHAQVAEKLKTNLSDKLTLVGYETRNTLINTGSSDWTKEKGLLSIWLLGMFTPSPQTMVIIPFQPIPNAGSLITKNYFGEIPANRLSITDSLLYFTCDGSYRSKIGISPRIAKPLASSFDFENNVLTVVVPWISKDAPYVNSKWEMQNDPYRGDVINSYNDGPLEDGSQLGPFYEIESSSPALALKKGESSSYVQTTIHLQGNYGLMKELVLQLLGVNLDVVKQNLKKLPIHSPSTQTL